MKVAVIGATGLVGQKMLQVLEERDFPVTELIPAASAASVGKTVEFKKQKIALVSVEEAINRKPHIALFSAGGSVSLKYAPAFAEAGCYVIDNSSAWRMMNDKKLVVPEVNSHVLTAEDRIIANPNCSTIQLVVALAPLHRAYNIKRLVISTYQSVTGTGYKAVSQLMDERSGKQGEKIYPHPIDFNCFPHGGTFEENGYTSEEIKLVNETRKILESPDMAITSTVVRIPVIGGHSESVNITFENEFSVEEVNQIFGRAEGIILQDNPAANLYPTPLHAHNKDDVFVGRIRRDESFANSLNIWVVSDNLRKGAATNALQIAETLIKKNFISC